MTDHQGSRSSSSSPSQDYTKPVQSFFGSPRFKAFTTKGHGETIHETVMMMSPTSVLDNKPFSPCKTPFWYESNQPKFPKTEEKQFPLEKLLDTKGIALALLDKPIEDTSSCYNPSPKVLFGAKLSIQIPPVPPSSISPSGSPADFGTKTRNPNLSPQGSAAINYGIQTEDFDGVFQGSLSVSEMELSEDYTRVISHGPNPKTTHIFGNFIVESHYSFSKPNSATKDFLSSCCTCRKNLDQKSDIFIYRGEQAFCSDECRYKAMLLDEVEN
ncbi:hypothetical protein HS088_TW22G00747 [Tripterygium wilfordii]|uniref:FLZ-type domain-containing protein n=1 Tax=Tripterygium wilfordii TaxID=458696 RepID=A0A7J7BYS3_TRIWF|nr:FCS-Like Zinc finger 8-like [Tripterygium wilfordii]XP_038692854.1 FCS-Like Zinc finger 8-like [Tripterygium wilfordii]XP_038692855.1 FCS-Like Zinc finger 8-like [Tripterygium wilfordii]XP_038692856.1 FCS-Like Zinc finger 8-like [Tripterygium wilfordii]KAF5727060.1 hypothetical protein HS088_TW22G00747 [Tripterygium wilfordii]